MHCPYCGKEISESAKVCPYCGREQKRKKAQVEKVAEAPPPDVANPTTTINSGVMPNSSGNSVNNRLWLAMGVMLLATFVGEIISTGIISRLNSDLYYSASGLISGLIIWLAITTINHPVSKKQGLTIVAAWTIAFAAHPILMGALGWVLARVLGAATAGYATGVVLLSESPHIRKNYPLTNALGWGAGWFAGFAVALLIGFRMPVFLSLPLDTILLILIAAAIGGFVLLKPLSNIANQPMAKAK